MSSTESGPTALNDAEFEELLRLASESSQSDSTEDDKESTSPVEDGLGPRRISCM